MLVNILLFIKFRHLIQAKRDLQGTNSSSNHHIEQMERSIKLMLFVGSANTIVGKLPDFVTLLSELFETDTNGSLFIKFCNLYSHTFLAISYTIKFLLYYLTNILFRNTFNFYFLRLIKLIF